jgi:hypothetical protein
VSRLGADGATLPVVAEEFPAYDQANVQIGLDAYLVRVVLIDPYGRGLRLHLADPGRVVARTAGVAAPFMKELMRKAAVLAAARAEDVHAALDELLEAGDALTRVLLGGEAAGAPRPYGGPGEGPGR